MVQLLSLILILVADCDECGFNDLGKLLLGGLLAAFLLGVAVSLLVRKSKGSHAETSSFVSITNTDQKR